MAQPKDNNNPFALIQQVPSKWQGLTGKRPNGFLQFADPVSGVRAGFINLINTYINKGLNTIEKIFPVYAPKGHGDNDPKAYINNVAKLSGIPKNKIIQTPEQIYAIGKAIVQVEEGIYKDSANQIGWLSKPDFDKGFQAAMSGKTIKKVAIASGGLILVVLAGVFAYMYFN